MPKHLSCANHGNILGVLVSRPNLDFSDVNFQRNKHDFLSTVDKTLRRYCDQRLCVEEFQLGMWLDDYLDHKLVSHLEKWIATLRNMGTKKFCLFIGLKHDRRRVKIPSVVFGTEFLQTLLVMGRFNLDKKTIHRIVLFKYLKALCLQEVSIKDGVFEKIISCCPLLEVLDVGNCDGLSRIKVNDLHNLKCFRFSMNEFAEGLCSIEIHPLSLETIDIDDGNIWFHKGADFCNLNCLSLWHVDSSLEHLSSCKFPSLENLKICNCEGLRGIQLFIDAPNIKRFQYGGEFVLSISFATTSNEWRSLVHLTYRHPNDTSSSWFLKLHELIKSLSQSEIAPTVDQHPRHDEEVIQENVNLVQDNGRDKPVAVKRLRFCCHMSSCTSTLLNTLFCICRPRSISQYCICRPRSISQYCICRPRSISQYRCRRIREMELEFAKRLCKILMQRRSGDLWGRDLEEVIFEIRDRNRKQWHQITMSEFPNYQQGEDIINARFLLKWGQT